MQRRGSAATLAGTMADPPKKTLSPEVLPAPTSTDGSSPRERARRRLETLAKRAAMAGAAGTLSACVGYGVVDPVPPPAQQCAPEDDVTSWASFSVDGAAPQLTLIVALNQFETRGVTLTTLFTADGATISGAPQFNGADLASSTTATIALLVNDGVTEVVVHTGLSCDGAGRGVDVHIDVATAVVTDIVDAGGAP
jgi:hypothetical protein